MKKTFLLIVLLVFILCGCAEAPKVENEEIIDARYTPSHEEIQTTQEYHFDIWGESWLKLMPNTHTVIVPDKYEIQYRRYWSDGKTDTEWREVPRDVYEEAQEQINKGE
jgi:ABC-type uncharacterized transport system auxiliary subunit